MGLNGPYGRYNLSDHLNSFDLRIRFEKMIWIFCNDIPSKSYGQVKNQENNNLQYAGTHCWMHFQDGFIEIYLGWIPRNFKIFIFKPNLSFLRENILNHRISMNSPMNDGYFNKKIQNHKYGEFVKIREFTLINIFVI